MLYLATGALTFWFWSRQIWLRFSPPSRSQGSSPAIGCCVIVISVAPFTTSAALYLVGLPQHCGLKDGESDFRKCARSMRLGPVLGFLYRRMNWHAEHHMYAAVPCYNLKKLSRVIADDMPEPRSLVGAWKEMRDTWKRQQSDPNHQFDLPLPETASSPVVGADGTDEGANELEKSIGELAPDGLS